MTRNRVRRFHVRLWAKPKSSTREQQSVFCSTLVEQYGILRMVGCKPPLFRVWVYIEEKYISLLSCPLWIVTLKGSVSNEGSQADTSAYLGEVS